jgi:hypothetical protein
MSPADLRRWIADSRAAQGLPATPIAKEIARIVAAVGSGPAAVETGELHDDDHPGSPASAGKAAAGAGKAAP